MGAMETNGNPDKKIVDDVETHTFRGFSAAAVIGLDYNLNRTVWGVNVTTQIIDGKVMPSINLKYGFYFVL